MTDNGHHSEMLDERTIIHGCVLDVLPLMEAGSIHMCATSPPFYGLRLYDGEPSNWPAVRYAPMASLADLEVEPWTGQLGLEPTVEMYVGHLVAVFRLVRRVLRDDGTLWLNLGDSFMGNGGEYGDAMSTLQGRKQNGTQGAKRFLKRGLPAKNLLGIPWRAALALQADGWWLRSEIIWAKGVSFCDAYAGSVMPESVTDRPTRAHEQVFLLTKKARYFYDAEAVREKWADARNGSAGLYNANHPYQSDKGNRGAPQVSGRNLRSVWTINPEPSTRAHFAGWPSRLVAPMVQAGTSERGVCGACGAPWERVVEHGEITSSGGAYVRHQGNVVKLGLDRERTMVAREKVTSGWRPTCSCEAGEPIPATVLDIFAGTGTTASVARRLGRYAVGIDRSAAYVKMQHERLAQQELFTQ